MRKVNTKRCATRWIAASPNNRSRYRRKTVKCYRVNWKDQDGDENVEWVNASSEDEAREMARALVGHKYFELTLTGI